jgi:hypothetical protein
VAGARSSTPPNTVARPALADAQIACAAREALHLGDNSHGVLGDGTTIDRITPVQVNLAGVLAVSMGANYGLALT